ncbi:MAG: TonB-dependent receptor [Bacteroidales bacterium]|nr:TonB-dependent receptor [Bacteroidales bacterium]
MYNYSSKLLLITALVFASLFAGAQTASIRGFVYDKSSGEPLLFTNVYLEKTQLGAATDENGYFVISKIPPGSYNLMVNSLGYDSLKVKVTLEPNQTLSDKFYLEPKSRMIEGVNVSARKQSAKTETKTSVVKITPKEIGKIPTIGGQTDLAQYLQVLPGVIFTGDQGGQLYIRGGSPIQNKVLLDGMVVYNPFHSIGLFSVFETDILRNADIYTGGFGAEYGGRISSVMDLTTKDGNKRRLSGKIGANTFGANVLLEGPIKKQEDDGGGTSSFILSFKNSYLKQTSEELYDYIDTTGLPYNYADYYGKISLNGANGSKLNLFGFNFTDRVNYEGVSDLNWDSQGAGMNFVVVPGDSPALLEGNFAYSSYDINYQPASAGERNSSIDGFNLGLDFTYFLGKDKVKYGLEMMGFKTVFDYVNSLGISIDNTQNTTELGGYVKYKMTKGKFIFEPSFRLQWYASLSNISPEPRVALKYNATDNMRFKLAGGFYSQNLISTRSDRDVVNLFYGFLSGPDNVQEKFDGETVTHKLQKAQHAIVGMEYDLARDLTMNVEAYYKYFSQLTNLNRNKIFEDNSDYIDKPDRLKKDFIIETGDAEGIDLSLKYDFGRAYLWGVYSFAYVNRYDGQKTYPPHYDRRHNVNFVASYLLGPNYEWEINARWNFGSGFPFTQTQSFYERIHFEGGINSDFTEENGELALLYADLNEGRLPTYHRFDLSVKYTYEFTKYTKLEANASVTNVYNRDNVFYRDRITGETVYQLPIMPSFGVTLRF